MMEPLPERIERFRLDPSEIDPERSQALDAIVARVRHRLANGQPRPVIYPARPTPPARKPEPPLTLRELAEMTHPAVLPSKPVPPPAAKPWPPPEPFVDIDMSRSMAHRVRQALEQGKRDTQSIMEITGASRASVTSERWLWFKRTGQKMPNYSLNEHIRACIAQGMTDARAIQAATGAARRNHIHRLLKAARMKAAQS